MKAVKDKKEKIEEFESPYFSFDGLEILTVIKQTTKEQYVYLRGSTLGEDDVCVVIIERKMFLKAMNDWLDRKQQFFKNWKHFCGVGNVYCNKYIEDESINIISYDDLKEDEGHKYIDVRSFIFLDAVVDMEHG